MTINWNDNVIDSRDVIEEFDTLTEELEAIEEQIDEAEGDEIAFFEKKKEEFLEENDYEEFKALIEECEGYSDWKYEKTLVNSNYWEDYVKEMLEDCGTIPKDLPWYVVIDWSKTANYVADDYAAVDMGGNTFYIRIY